MSLTVKVVDPARGESEFILREPTPEEEDRYLVKRRSKVVGGKVVDDAPAARLELFDLLLESATKDGKVLAAKDIPPRYKFTAIFQAFENFSIEVVTKN